MDGEEDPLIDHDYNQDDDEETTSGHPFTSTPGPSGAHQGEHIVITTFEGGDEDKTGDAETSLIEGNVPPEKVFKSVKALNIWEATSKLKYDFPKMK